LRQTVLQLLESAKLVLGLRNAFNNQVALLQADRRGVAAIEFAIFAGLMSFATLNVAEISIYIYQRMEVENATEMAAQAAWKNCDLTMLPATTKCPALSNAVQNAMQSTSLGSRVTLKSGSPSEGYYCVNSSNSLEYVSDVASKPADCTAAGTPSLQPADYIKIQTTFAYQPLFQGITVGDTFATPITKTAWMRLD
jgi:Flp pilus assembly protein TadG